MRVFFADHEEVALPPEHRFPMHKYRMLHEHLLAEGVLSPTALHPGPPITRKELLEAHAATYVDAFLEGALDRRTARQIGLPWSPSLVRRCLAAVGGTLAAARHALHHEVAGNLAGGTHHAMRTHGEGFCVFNDLAVATLNLLRGGVVERVAIIDLDVHQGNGTASILGAHPGVFTLSVHGERNYPFRKVHGTLDVGLPDGAGDEVFLEVVADTLPRVMAFAPDLVLYQAGVDALHEDTLGRLSLTHDGLLQRDRLVLTACQRHGVPVALTLGGGYARPITPTVQAYANTYRAAVELYGGGGR